MKNQSQINCPNCGTSIDVQDILTHQLEDEIKQKYQSQIAEDKKKYDAEQEKLKQDKLAFEQKKKPELSEETKKHLQAIYHDDIGSLEVLLAKDLSAWK